MITSVTDWSSKVTQTISNSNNMITRYGKPVMITEIGMDYNQLAAAKNFVTGWACFIGSRRRRPDIMEAITKEPGKRMASLRLRLKGF